MRVFVTGATGFIGSAIVKELLGSGHTVLGLVRSESSAAALAATGAEVLRGDLTDPDSLKCGAAGSDGVIHTAFIHDFSNFAANCEVDRRAIEALGDALQGSNRPLVITSGTALVNPGHLATEEQQPAADSTRIPRIASEEAASAIAARGVRASVMRLPPSVHGEGDHGFVPMLIGLARQKGVSAYIGEGANRWPAVHRLDAAHAFCLALEKAATGARFHAIGDQGIPTREIAEVIGRHLGLPVRSISPADAAGHFGWMTHFFSLDAPASGQLTEQQLGFHPTHPCLLPDLEQGHYFKH